MTNATHTQGPWWLDDYGYIVVGSRETYVTIAEIDCSIFRKAEREANAHLIAAAPDLLAALEAVLADFDHPGLRGLIHTHWGAEKEISMRQSIATARAAISKTQGA
jgi:hypothetical protein